MNTVKTALAKRTGLFALALVLAIGLSAIAAFALPAARGAGAAPEGDIVVIGDGTSADFNHPYCSYYKNGGTQTIYTAAELGETAGNITSIAFNVKEGGPAATSSVKVYMGHTDQSAFSAAIALTPLDGWTLVYSGNPTLGEATGWEQLAFQNAFEYNGENNLLVCIVRQASVDKKVYYYHSATENNMVLRSQSDSNAVPYETAETFVSPATEGKTTSGARPNTQFTIEYVRGPKFTTQPVGFTYQAGTENTASLTAVAQSADASFTYQWYKSADANLKADGLAAATAIGTQGTATVAGGSATITYTPSAADLGTASGTIYLYCAATDSDGTSLSKPAAVDIYTAAAQAPIGELAIESSPAANEGAVSANALTSVTLTATGAQPAQTGDGLHYQWFVKTDGAEDFAAIEGANEAIYNAQAELDKTNTYRYEVWAHHEVASNVSAHRASPELAVTGAPVTIGTEAELRAFAAAVNSGSSYEGLTITLESDIALTSSWTAIGTATAPFKGTFAGGGHVISGLNVESTADNQGLFGYVNSATVENLVVQGSGVSGKAYVAGVVGRAEGSTTIRNAGNEAPVSSTSGNSGGIVGGASTSSSTQIVACYNKAAISTSSNGARTGGIIGYGAMSTAVTSCYNTGAITCTATSNYFGIGGIAGYDSTISNCINTGLVTDPGSYHGSIMGEQASIRTGDDINYYLAGTSDKVGGSGTPTAIELSAEQLSGAAYYNGAPLLTSLNVGSYADIWIDGGEQGCPMLFWEVVEGSPVITTQPESAQYAATDTIAALTCEAEYPKGSGSDAGLSYEWFMASDKNTPLATGKTFTPTVAPGSQCIFVCVVTNPNDGNPVSVTSKAATIKVLGDYAAEAPAFTAPTEATAVDGKLLTPTQLEATAGVATGELTYQWFACDDAEKANSQAIDSATSTKYKFTPTEEDTYYFFCRATNTDEFARADAQTATTDSPVFTVTVGQYTISTPAELAAFRDTVNSGQNFAGQTVYLKADLDLQDDLSTMAWKPINFFAGTFDGEGHTIDGLQIDVDGEDGSVQGLFSTLRGNAIIKNLVIGKNSSVKGTYQVGGIAGNVMQASVQIINCGNNAAITARSQDTFDGTSCVGGIVGGIASYANGSATIIGCYNKGEINGKGSGIGGIVGGVISSSENNRYTSTITSCYNAGVVTNPNGNRATGGIVGMYAKVVNCVNVGSVPNGRDGADNLIGAIGGLAPQAITAEGDYSYYLDTSSVNSVGASAENAGHEARYYISKTADELSAADMVDALNAGDYTGTWIAGGYATTAQDYPALSWEVAPAFVEQAATDLSAAEEAAQAAETKVSAAEQAVSDADAAVEAAVQSGTVEDAQAAQQAATAAQTAAAEAQEAAAAAAEAAATAKASNAAIGDTEGVAAAQEVAESAAAAQTRADAAKTAADTAAANADAAKTAADGQAAEQAAAALSELTAAITAAEAIDTSSLTPEQKAALEAAIAAAKEYAAGAEGASAADIQQVTAALNTAVKDAKDAIDAAAAKPADDQATQGEPAKQDEPAKTSEAAKKATSITVNVKKVTASAVASAVKKAGTDAASVKTITLGSKVKKIAKGAFKKMKKATTLVIKTKKLTKKSVKGSLKGSKVKTVKVPKKKLKAYKKIFTKKNCGSKVKIS